jgi:hypothetical protein
MPEADVRHEAPGHDVELQPVGAGRLDERKNRSSDHRPYCIHDGRAVDALQQEQLVRLHGG